MSDKDKGKMEDINKKPDGNEKEEGGFGKWWEGISGEFKRITWPNRPELVKMVVTVIVTSGVVGAIIVGYDFLLAAGYDLLLNLFG